MASKKQDTTPEAVAAGIEASAGQGREAETVMFVLLTALRRGGKRIPAGSEVNLSMEEAGSLPSSAIRRVERRVQA